MQIDLRKHGTIWEDFYDGLVSEQRRKETSVSSETVKADLIKRGRQGLAQKRNRADVIRDLLDFGKGRKLEGMSIRQMIAEAAAFRANANSRGVNLLLPRLSPNCKARTWGTRHFGGSHRERTVTAPPV